LTFTAGEDENLMMLPPGSAPEHFLPVQGQAPCFSAISSTTSGACSDLDPYAGLHIHTVKLIQGIPIVASILHPSARALSSSSLTALPEQDSADNYPEIGDPVEEGRLIVMVARLEGLGRIAPADIPPSRD
jgi:hypothetical protein